MHEQWTDRLSELLDGELSPKEQAEVERHLAGCAACARVLAELREVTQRASMLGELPPRKDLWPGIHGRIADSQLGPRLVTPIPLRERRVRVSVPRLIAASIALVALGGTSTWLVMRGPLGSGPSSNPTAAATGDGTGATGAPGGVTAVGTTPGQLAQTRTAIAQLEATLAGSRARLDPETLKVIDENLAVIDAAIEEVREALADDPSNAYLNLYMAETMERKLQLLQEVEDLAEQLQ